MNSNEFNTHVDTITKQLGDLLKEKNKKYGNSAINPVRIFSSSDELHGILVRIDDKLSRIASSGGFDGYLNANDDEDVLDDLVGYLVLLKIAMLNKSNKSNNNGNLGGGDDPIDYNKGYYQYTNVSLGALDMD